MMRNNPSLTCTLALRAVTCVSLIVVFSAVGGGVRASQPKSPAGFYRGTGTAKRVVDLNVATLHASHDSDFWFTIDSKGNADGYAVVRYDLSLDDAPLRSLIAHANSVADFSIGKIPTLPSILGPIISLPRVLGASTRYDEFMPVRQGAIKGRVTGDGLHLEWAEAPSELAYTTYRHEALAGVGVPAEHIVTKGTAPAYSPWSSDARLIEAAPGQWQAFVTSAATHRTRDNVRTMTFWTAHRVCPAQ